MKVTIDPAVLAKIAQLAGIKDSPLTGSVLEICGLEKYPGALDQSLTQLLGRCVIQTTSRKQFEQRVQISIESAQNKAAWRYEAKLRRAKIGRLAHQLKEALKTAPPELSHYLQSRDLLPTDQYVAIIGGLAEAAQQIKRTKKTAIAAMRPGKWAEWGRRYFVETLLDAAQEAGGKLSVNSHNSGGSLIEVINLLPPYLPAEYRGGLSARTAPNNRGQKSRQKLNKR